VLGGAKLCSPRSLFKRGAAIDRGREIDEQANADARQKHEATKATHND
jgi:hypothetical protein